MTIGVSSCILWTPVLFIRQSCDNNIFSSHPAFSVLRFINQRNIGDKNTNFEASVWSCSGIRLFTFGCVGNRINLMAPIEFWEKFTQKWGWPQNGDNLQNYDKSSVVESVAGWCTYVSCWWSQCGNIISYHISMVEGFSPWNPQVSNWRQNFTWGQNMALSVPIYVLKRQYLYAKT